MSQAQARESLPRSLNPAQNNKTCSIKPPIAQTNIPTKGLMAPPLAKKPEILVINVAEQDLDKNHDEEAIVICAKIEAELAELGEEDARAYLRELGIERSGLDQIIQAAYKKLGLMSFLTAGEKEARAWTINKGITALEAAGVIHTDFMKKFIKADVVNYDDFVRVGGWKAAREAGLVRIEGRDYVMQEGDVVEFRIGA